MEAILKAKLNLKKGENKMKNLKMKNFKKDTDMYRVNIFIDGWQETASFETLEEAKEQIESYQEDDEKEGLEEKYAIFKNNELIEEF